MRRITIYCTIYNVPCFQHLKCLYACHTMFSRVLQNQARGLYPAINFMSTHLHTIGVLQCNSTERSYISIQFESWKVYQPYGRFIASKTGYIWTAHKACYKILGKSKVIRYPTNMIGVTVYLDPANKRQSFIIAVIDIWGMW